MTGTSRLAGGGRAGLGLLSTILGAVMVFGLAVPTAWARSSAPADDELSITQTDTPDPVSSGNDVAYVLTVSGEDIKPRVSPNSEGLILTDTLPTGSTFVSADPSQGTCSEQEGVVTCDLGEVGEGNTATVQIVVQVPSVDQETTITNTAVVDEEGDARLGESAASTEDTVVLAPNQDLTIGFVPDTGLVLNTDLGTGATEDNPTTTQMTIPAGRSGPASIAEGEGQPSDCPPPFVCFGQRIDLSAPEGYGAPRLRITFTFDASSLPPGIQLSDVQMFRDGVLVPMCHSPNYADPCVQGKRFIGGGDLRLLVCSSETSGWRGGA